jgi:8-oxo-dGTP diphosphatase
MALPYKIATLLYFFNEQDEVLLLKRTQEPNLGMWSPCGGKLKTDAGESPYACACREAFEEVGLKIEPADLHLSGLISEHGYQGQAHWLMFLFEPKPRLKELPAPHQAASAARYAWTRPSISAFVRFSVTATLAQSARSGCHWPSARPA